MDRRTFITSAAGALALPSIAVAGDVQDFEWHDAARSRTLPLRLRRPAGAGPWPLVLHSHGLGGSRNGGDVWGRAWCDAGLAVLHLQHPGSDSALWAGGMRGVRRAASGEQLAARVADVAFVLDELQRRRTRALLQGIDLDAIGMSGHSFGARTTQVLAGQRVAGGAARAEARLRAFVAFSPSMPKTGGSAAFAGVTRPFLALTGSLDADPLTSSDGQARAEVYAALPPGAKAQLWLDGADHATFGGGTGAGPDGRRTLHRRERKTLALEAQHHALIARVTTSWWRAHLQGDAAARAALRAPNGLAPGDRWDSA